MLKNRLVQAITVIIIFLCVVSAGARERGDTAGKITVVDAFNRSVEVPSSPRRVMAFFPFVGEIIFALDGSDLIAGRVMNCVFPPSISSKPDLGSPTAPDMERLLELSPDVVISCGMHTKEEVREKIEALGIPVVAFEYNHFSHILQAVDTIGLMLDKREKAEQLHNWMQHHVDLVRSRVEKLSPEDRVKVYIEHGTGEFKSISAQYGFNDLIAWAGGINIAEDLQVPVPIVSAEWVLEQDPDCIVIYGHPPAVRVDRIPDKGSLVDYVDQVLARRQLQDMTAIKNRRVSIAHVRVITGPRMVVGLCYLAKFFYPQLFEDIDPEEIDRDFFQRFWGTDLQGEFFYDAGKRGHMKNKSS